MSKLLTMPKSLSTLFLFLITGFFFACQAKENLPGLQEAIWIDVRTSEEYASGHLEGAKNIPHEVVAQQIAEIAPDKNASIVVYCRSGRRSAIAQEALQALGYTQVINAGAYDQLKGSVK